MTKWIVTLLATTALLPAAALAQTDAADTGADAVPGEIIVTAQRYEQRLQDVPLSVSVVDAKELAARGITDLRDMQFSIPGFSSYETGAGRQTLQLRGIASTIGASTVGLYFDETPLSLDTGSEAFNIRMIDLERVEVLRGPQATLYGQGSMGGTIRYIPAAPKLDAIGAAFDGEYSTTRYGASNYRAVGVFNLPLTTDVAAVRLVAGYERVGGYIDNVVTGAQDINGADMYTVRGSFLLKPNDRFSISLMGLYQKTDQANQDIGMGYKTASTVPSPGRDRYLLAQAKMTYDFDFAALTTSASWIDRRNLTQFDVSGYFVPVLVAGLGLPPGFIDQVGVIATTEYAVFNSEIRLASPGDARFGWQFGAAYNDLQIHQFGGTFTAPGALPFALVDNDDVRESQSYTLFGEAHYAIVPQLTATLGLRYYSERKTRNVFSTNFGLTSTDTGRETFDTVNPRFNLSYEITPDSMVYANVAKGFRSGGFNQTSSGGAQVAVLPAYQPDQIWTYEFGTKHQLFGNRLILDASVYRSDWSDVQSTNFAPGGVATIINNSGHVSGWGVDLSAIARPVRDLTLTATYGWNNLAYDEVTADKNVGDPVDAAVRQSWSAALDYRPALSERVTGIFRLDYQHAGRGQFTLRNLPVAITDRPSRDLVNLRVGVGVGPVELAVFANNLLDENAPSIVGPFATFLENVEQRPRVIGISASGRF